MSEILRYFVLKIADLKNHVCVKTTPIFDTATTLQKLQKIILNLPIAIINYRILLEIVKKSCFNSDLGQKGSVNYM